MNKWCCRALLVIWLIGIPFFYQHSKSRIVNMRVSKWTEAKLPASTIPKWTEGDRNGALIISPFWPIGLPLEWLLDKDFSQESSW